MASIVPAKTQPLHNFSLPHLKWKKNHHSNNHQRGRSSSSSGKPSSSTINAASPSPSPSRHDSPQRQSRSHSPLVHSPMRDSRQSPMRPELPPFRQSPFRGDSALEVEKVSVEIRRYSRNSALQGGKKGVHVSSSTDRAVDKLEKKLKVPSEIDVGGSTDGRSSKILLKIPRKSKVEEAREERKLDEVQEGQVNGIDEEVAEDLMPKTWNLRPRKPIQKSLNVNGGGASKAVGSTMQENKTNSPQRNLTRPEGESNCNEKKGKRPRILVPLSREDIEEDIFVMTGSKPARRPKKRAKAVQKQLDTLFPGLWLASITPDSYKVSENPPKG